MAFYWKAGLLGRYVSGDWLGEQAYMGISGVAIDGGGDFTGINKALPSFDARPDGTYVSAASWERYGGSVGAGSWSYEHQDQVATALLNFATAVKAAQHASFRWQEIRLAAFGNDDKVINGATVYQLKTAVSGSGATFAGGPERAIAVSWRTGGRGSRNRGRTYVPAPCYGITTGTGLIGSTNMNTIGNAAKALHTAVDAIPGLAHVVVSRVWKTYSDITSVEIGDEFDTQSRRRRERPESYTAY